MLKINSAGAVVAKQQRDNYHICSNDGIGNENKHTGNGAYFVVIASSSHPLLVVDRARFKWTGRSVFEVNVDNERFTVVCSRCS